MRIKVLHIIDVYLPETMNWLEELILLNSERYEHHIFALNKISEFNPNIINARPSKQSVEYPISFIGKLIQKLSFPFINRELNHYCRTNAIQIIHIHFGNIAILFRKFLYQSSLTKVISIYGYDYEYLVHKNPSTKEYYSNLAKHNCHFIAQGKYSKSKLASYNIPIEKIHLVHMLYDRGISSLPPEYKQPIRFVQIATFTRKKGQDIFIQAASRQKDTNFTIDFYGEIADPIYYQKLLQLAQENTHLCIRFHPKLSVSDYFKIMQSSHIAVNLSRTTELKDTEGGCPVFIKDALWFGRPVFATTHCDIPEIVIHKFNGWLAKEDDIDSASRLLSEILLLSQKEYFGFSTNAQQSVRSNATNHIAVDEIHDCYSRLLQP